MKTELDKYQAQHKYQQSHKEYYNQKGKEYYKKHREEIRKRRRQEWILYRDDEKHRKKRRESYQTFYRTHREEIKKKNDNYAKIHKEQIKISRRNYQKKLCEKVLVHYSNGTMRCACKNCYYSTHDCPIEFLTIDHIHGGGSQHQKELRSKGLTFYSWLIKNNFPEGFQVLCYNCNCGRARNNNICPHLS